MNGGFLMYHLPDFLYEINLLSVSLRLILALLFGGIIGLERGSNRHPAGFRTHILVCVGAALAMMTNQFILQQFDTGDPARLGAQVITGVGFLGVGTILVTGRHKIKGLTTAAGLWASACLGLAIGIGFYSGALVAALIIFISLTMLPRMENYFYQRSRVLEVYVEANNLEDYREVTRYIKSIGSTFMESHIIQTSPVTNGAIAINLSVMLPKEISRQEALATIESMDGIFLVEEI